MFVSMNPYVPTGFNQMQKIETNSQGVEHKNSPSPFGKQLATVLDTPNNLAMVSTAQIAQNFG